MGGGRIEDEFALAHENGQGEVEGCFWCAHVFMFVAFFMCFDGLTEKWQAGRSVL
jgi:hypothetical protein